MGAICASGELPEAKGHSAQRSVPPHLSLQLQSAGERHLCANSSPSLAAPLQEPRAGPSQSELTKTVAHEGQTIPFQG